MQCQRQSLSSTSAARTLLLPICTDGRFLLISTERQDAEACRIQSVDLFDKIETLRAQLSY